MNNKTYIFILCHADIWGAINANRLVKGIADFGLLDVEPLLFVSYSTKAKDGSIAIGKNPGLKDVREVKEGALKNYFSFIDEKQYFADPKLLTFENLARRYCADKTVHYLDNGGLKGATQMLSAFGALDAKGIIPEIVLSGDTLAFVPKEIINSYPCFGTHPGPLPQIPGMHATLRSVLYRQFFYADGRPFHPFFQGKPQSSLQDSPFAGLRHVAGTFFNLREVLDEGPPLHFIYTPYIDGMSLVDLRHGVYKELTSTMLTHLPILLMPKLRDQLIVDKSQIHERRRKLLPLTVPVLEECDLQKLLRGDSHAIGYPIDPFGELEPSNQNFGAIEVIRPSLLNSSAYKNLLHEFWPSALSEVAFENSYQSIFPDLDRFNNNTIESYELEGLGTNKDGSTYPKIRRHVRLRSPRVH